MGPLDAMFLNIKLWMAAVVITSDETEPDRLFPLRRPFQTEVSVLLYFSVWGLFDRHDI